MNNIDPKLLKKYFRAQCTPEEAIEVLAWFRTPEGMLYLERHIDNYNEIIRNANNENFGLAKPGDSEKMYSDIQNRIRLEVENRKSIRVHQAKLNRNGGWEGYLMKVSAVVLVMVFVATVYWWMEPWGAVEHLNDSIAIVHVTEQNQHMLLTLYDGTTVRLNENSSLTIPNDHDRDVTRRVELTGEAFFDVKNIPGLPFEIIADKGFIRVLGTQFNVKVDHHSNHMQVAVLEGKVALGGAHEHEHEGSSTELTQGYFGVYNFRSLETTIEETTVENYISWINKVLIFENTPLWKISRQLHWLYGTSFSYEDEEIRDLHLYASLSKDDLDEVLSIIASTLEIDYRLEGNEVKWKRLESNQ